MRGRRRARRLYPDLGVCEHCRNALAVDRHHVNGDTDDNRRENVQFLCRRCHMLLDGRLDVFKSTSASLWGPQPAKQCGNCGQHDKPLRHGRCKACSEYRRRHGAERPKSLHRRRAGASRTAQGTAS